MRYWKLAVLVWTFLTCVLNVKVSAKTNAAEAVTETSATESATTRTVVTFHSSSLGRMVSYTAVHPVSFVPGKRYPVLYLLHGATGSHADWTTMTSGTEIIAGRPLIVINPDGGPFGWYLDSNRKSGSRYESFITKDLVQDVDARFPTVADRKGRGVAGLSMGGHGALSLAAKHPDLFASGSSMSGILHLQNHPKNWQLPDLLGGLPGAEAEWQKHSVYNLVDSFASASVALLFDTGTSDTLAVRDNRQVHERLTNRGIKHTYREFPGAHTWKYWGARLPEHLEFHEKVFRSLETGKPVAAGAAQGGAGDHYREMALKFEKENAELWSKPDAPRPIVLLGSSSFEIIHEKQLFPNLLIANRGISGDVIGLGERGLLHRLDCSVFQLRPTDVFVLNGTNDLGGTARTGKPTVDRVAGCYGEVVRRIREGVPDARVFVVSCTPTRDNHAAASPFIAKYNAEIRKLAESGDPKIRYVDTFSSVVGPDGLLKPEYSRDGLHLNAAGYEIMKAKFLEALKE